ncbi:MAG: phage tail length tape measure family protein [Candidatus Omnitrophica bacterium]|nr:phage tail length tape measure family protein [Candidatus Omnitrophota bacterium]
MANLIEILLKSNSGQVVAELGKVDKSLGKTGKTAKETGGMFDGLGKNIANLAAGYLTLQGAAMAINYVIDAAAEAEVVQAQLNAVLESTAGAAGMSSDELNDLANSLSQLSGTDDELIVKQEAVMLTFTKISKEVFPEAMEAALNMSAALGQDLQSSVIQLGKALNDPIQGVTALRRVGVMLTDQQEKQIKVLVEQNDLLGAQKMVLAELQTEFGGAAEAMGNTYTGSVNKLKVSIGNLAETIGSVFLPELQKGIDKVAEWINSLVYAIEVELKINQAVEDGKITREEANRIINEYTWGTMTAADAEEWLAEKTGETTEATKDSDKALDDRIQSIEANRKAMSGLGDEERWLKKREQELKETMEELSTVMAGRLGEEMDNYGEKLLDINKDLGDLQSQIDEHIAKIGELNQELRGEHNKDACKRIKEQIQEEQDKVAELRGEYSELEGSIKDVAEEHAIATRKIIFDILQQQLAMDGLTQQEADALVTVAGKWGLIDQETQDAWNAISDYIKGLEGASVTAEGVEDAVNRINGGEPMVEFNTQVGEVEESLGDATDAAILMGQTINNESDKSVSAIEKVIKKVSILTKNLTTLGNSTFTPTIAIYQTPVGGYLSTQVHQEFQHGAEDFVVPPGYPNDSYIVGLTSGERVDVTPANIESNINGGSNINVYLQATISNDMDLEVVAYRLAEHIKAKQRER